MEFFKNLLQRHLPIVKADEEEIVDPQKKLREKCSAKHCASLEELLTKCNDRVNSRKKTAEVCFEELIDYVQCVDHCVAETLFTKLK